MRTHLLTLCSPSNGKARATLEVKIDELGALLTIGEIGSTQRIRCRIPVTAQEGLAAVEEIARYCKEAQTLLPLAPRRIDDLAKRLGYHGFTIYISHIKGRVLLQVWAHDAGAFVETVGAATLEAATAFGKAIENDLLESHPN